jgi:hypothetical protein
MNDAALNRRWVSTRLAVLIMGLCGLPVACDTLVAESPLRIATFQCEITPAVGEPIGLGFILLPKTVEHPLLAKGVVLTDAGGVKRDGTILTRSSSTTDPVLQAAPEGLIDPWLRTFSFVRDGMPLAQIHYYATHPQSFLSYIGGDRIYADRGGYEQTYAFSGPCDHLLLMAIDQLLAGKGNSEPID